VFWNNNSKVVPRGLLQMLYRDVLYAIPRFPEPGNSVNFFRRKPFRFLGYVAPGSEILSTCTKRNVRTVGKKFGQFAVSLGNDFIVADCF